MWTCTVYFVRTSHAEVTVAWGSRVNTCSCSSAVVQHCEAANVAHTPFTFWRRGERAAWLNPRKARLEADRLNHHALNQRIKTLLTACTQPSPCCASRTVTRLRWVVLQKAVHGDTEEATRDGRTFVSVSGSHESLIRRTETGATSLNGGGRRGR